MSQPPSVLELEGQVILWAHGPFDVVQNQFLGIQQMLYDRAASYEGPYKHHHSSRAKPSSSPFAPTLLCVDTVAAACCLWQQ
ncbi:hypothetical protein W97_05695 [Coniosporium apollinis CBS 100218]|uniref:Uncharacterized protein n=1 Tax=Coniosporium apollinis (strain CBS 100218) TaxID=1168221 RepID=R7YWL9_CONA1|nr:uncharacterized protein W97_05695 [Coniosporium apollinis CBS 100218]EON66302.1 hypothetical protein W97_05695 [Coniosporium apollinis CBS 100218]